MPPTERKYTDEQRDALERALLDRGIRPYRRISELAKAGELEPGLAPFDVPTSTVAAFRRTFAKRRAGVVAGELARNPPRDAIEGLRRRLIDAADRELKRIERAQRSSKAPADMEKLRQIARACREIAALPGPTDPRPVAMGSHDPATGKNNGTQTKGGVGGAILRAHRQGAAAEWRPDFAAPSADVPHTHIGGTAQDVPQQATEHGRQGVAQRHDDDGRTEDDSGDGAPSHAATSDLHSAGALALAMLRGQEGTREGTVQARERGN